MKYNMYFYRGDTCASYSIQLDYLCIDIWISVMIICLKTQMTERQGTATYPTRAHYLQLENGTRSEEKQAIV